MPVKLTAPQASTLLPVRGVKLGYAEAHIRKAQRKDLLVITLAEGSAVSGVFTQNQFCAAPVTLCKSHLAAKQGIRALLVNTGCANAGTGEQGMQAAQQSCAALAALLDLNAEQILPFSTGVILEPLPVDKLISGLPTALANLNENNWLAAAEAIMTTDIVAKATSRRLLIDGQTVTITGMSKGSGMIHPNMATMLGYISTDAVVSQAALDAIIHHAVNKSFNCITVDGDTSTNDSLIMLASQQAGHAQISETSPHFLALRDAMTEVAIELAQAIVRDGEGATKFITIQVEGGRDGAECRQVAYAIAHSPLVKTAFFASDPNLGRILAAVGYAGIADLDQTGIDLYLDAVHVAVQGGRHPAYREEDGQRVMKQSEITVRVVLGRGTASDTVWTCDLSHDYVSINADYRS